MRIPHRFQEGSRCSSSRVSDRSFPSALQKDCSRWAVIAEGGSLYEVCDRLVRAQHPKISPLDGQMDILYNEYCTTWGNPSYENLKRICDKIAGKGIRYLVIDSGWVSVSSSLHRISICQDEAQYS